jgi:hypothetical protein
VAPDDAERNNLVTKKMKKEETSPTTWDSCASLL